MASTRVFEIEALVRRRRVGEGMKQWSVSVPAPTIGPDTVKRILTTMGGRSTKTALCKEVMSQCNLTRRDAMDALDVAVAEKQVGIALPKSGGKPANSVVFELISPGKAERTENQ